LGGEIDLGEGLDDLDLGGAAAAQLNVGLPDPEEDGDVPWPLARTPLGDELSVSAREAVEMSGFGLAPKSFQETPLYAWRVFRALPSLRMKQREAEQHLREVENMRDEMLAALAEEKRNELQKSDRFAALFSQIAAHEENIKQRKRDLEMADVEGAVALRAVQTEIDALNIERLAQAKTRDEKRVVLEAAELSLKRQQAALKRIQIEWRNIEARAAKVGGSHIPQDLDAKLDVLEAQRVRAQADLDLAHKSLKEAKGQLAVAENDVRVAVAGVQRAEGKKEGLLLESEGDIAERSRALDRAIAARQKELASAGRAIVDLRGQVPVKGAVRSHLLAADERVMAAARQLEIVTRALGSMDADAYGTGRATWIGGFLILLVLLFWSAL
jgi:chromosome segregation ATPase